LTQHSKIWEVVSEKAKSIKNGTVGKHILERYLKLNPDFIEDYVSYLKDIRDWRAASRYLLKLIDDERFVSSKGRSKYEFCMELCEMVAHNPESCTHIDGESVIRHSIKRYTDEVGNLWNFLAEFYIRQGLFEKARDMFEEGIESVMCARDFGIVYSAYLKFEEELLTIVMEEGEDEEDQELQTVLREEEERSKYLDALLEIEDRHRLE
jgi:pre-mRNA-splicing factor SYF1